MNTLITRYKSFILLAATLFLSSCADWNSVPVAVDDSFGDSVRHMIKAQTLNPDAGLAVKPVFGLDGQKSEGIIKAYRSGTAPLSSGKSSMAIDVNSN